MFNLILVYMSLSLLLSLMMAPLIIDTLKNLGIKRQNSRNVQEVDVKTGTPIMGGLIFIIPIILLGIVANYNVTSSLASAERADLLGGSIKILLTTFVISAILGGMDDILNIYGTERPVKSFKRIARLILIHKSIFQRVKTLILLPWTAYKSFFFMLGSNPGKGIQAHEKILVQVFVGLIMSWWIYGRLGFDTLWIPYFGDIFIGIFMIPLIIFSIVLTSNAVNISDGMDGLSSGLSIISFCGFLLAATISIKNEPIAIICAIAIGSLLTYLFFNAKPAIVEMGDVGSLALGTLLAGVAFSLNRPILLLPFCGVFYLEILTSLIQGMGRRILGRRIFKMAPLHHHFEMLGLKEETVVIRLWILAMIFFMVGLWVVL